MKDQTVIGVSSGGLAKSHPIVCDFREKGENRCHCLKRIKVGYFLSHIFSAWISSLIIKSFMKAFIAEAMFKWSARGW